MSPRGTEPEHAKAARAEPRARKRRTAEQARARILSAAERRLSEVGPEGLRLTELASELGISHPAILHHFGSREELVAAVVARAMGRLNQRLTESLAGRARGGREAVLDMIADFYGAEGNARLIAWLILSKRAVRRRQGSPPALRGLIELAHAQRQQAHPERTIDFDESKWRSQLTAVALLGDAVFGDMVRYASGDPIGAEQSRDFRKRLAKLLADTD